MKKRNLFLTTLTIILGVIFFNIGINIVNNALLCGFSGGLIGLGINLAIKYWKNERRQNHIEYEKKLKEKALNNTDERKKVILHQAGYFTFYTLVYISLFIIIIVTILSSFNLVSIGIEAIICLVIYPVFQLGINQFIITRVEKKYK